MNGDIEDKLFDYDFAKGEAEDKADKFAANILIDPVDYGGFVIKKNFTLFVPHLAAKYPMDASLWLPRWHISICRSYRKIHTGT